MLSSAGDCICIFSRERAGVLENIFNSGWSNGAFTTCSYRAHWWLKLLEMMTSWALWFINYFFLSKIREKIELTFARSQGLQGGAVSQIVPATLYNKGEARVNGLLGLFLIDDERINQQDNFSRFILCNTNLLLHGRHRNLCDTAGANRKRLQNENPARLAFAARNSLRHHYVTNAKKKSSFFVHKTWRLRFRNSGSMLQQKTGWSG